MPRINLALVVGDYGALRRSVLNMFRELRRNSQSEQQARKQQRALLLLPLLAAVGINCNSIRAEDAASMESALSLLDAYEVARGYDTDIAVARFSVDIAAANRDVASGKNLPQVSLFGEWSENKVNYEGSTLGRFPSQQYSGERYGLQLRTPVFNWRNFSEYQRQKALVDQSTQELAIAETELLSRVVEAYLTVLLTEEDVSQFESELSALEQQLKEANALYAKSLLPVTEVLETQTRTDALRADVLNARGQAAIAFEQLFQLVGFRNFSLQSITNRFALLNSVQDVESAANLAMELDPSIGAAKEALLAARKSIDREKGAWLPEVDFVYNAQYSDVGFDNLTSPPRNTSSLSLSLRYPLFEGGAGKARLRGAWAEFYSAQQRLEGTKREASGRARAAWVNLESASERVLAARQAVSTAATNLDASRKAVQAGTARVTDVLLALAQKTRSQRDLNEARFQRAMSWLELELATGADPVALAPKLSKALHGP